MTIQEIETVLDELSSRHAPLSKDLLVTLLTASNWEEKNIKEAVALFTSQQKRFTTVRDSTPLQEETPKEEVSLPLSKDKEEEIVFYHPDGSEEKKLEPLPEAPTVIREVLSPLSSLNISEASFADDQQKTVEDAALFESEQIKEGNKKEEGGIQAQEEKKEEQQEVVDGSSKLIKSDEAQSLVIPKEDKKPTKQEAGIPDTLPLLPFESSEHIWDFSKYKQVFHGDEEKKSSPQESFVAEVSKHAIPHELTQVEVVEGGHQVIEEEDIVAEKTPMNKGDESLVFLAVLMLLAIMLILGYMYSNGRL